VVGPLQRYKSPTSHFDFETCSAHVYSTISNATNKAMYGKHWNVYRNIGNVFKNHITVIEKKLYCYTYWYWIIVQPCILAQCYNGKPVICLVLMAEILLTRTKNKARCMICNAQVKCYSNTTNLWKHLTSHIRRLDFCNEWKMFSLCSLTIWRTHENHLQLLWESLP